MKRTTMSPRTAILVATAAVITMGGGVALGVAVTLPMTAGARGSGHNIGPIGSAASAIAARQTPIQCLLINEGHYNAAPTNACDAAGW
jgi:hypothetical protein